jgi:tetratricopeptide (TPR) repeat protein
LASGRRSSPSTSAAWRGTLTRERLEELLLLLEVPPEAIDAALFAQTLAVPPEPTGSPVDPTPAERRSIQRTAAHAGQEMKEATFQRLTRNIRRARAAAARRHAGRLWEALKRLPPGERRRTVETEKKYWVWALAERLCAESERAAAHRADRAVELAALALRIAELAPGGEAWRSRLQGYAWAFVGNARRVHGDLPAAEQAFVRSDRLWAAGAPADPGLLDATRPLDLKASLRLYQGRLPEALALLEQALKANGSPVARGRLLIKKAKTFEIMGDYERAVAELRRAAPLLKESKDVRLPWAAQHGLAHNLWQLGRYAEAEALLREIKQRAVEMGNQLDLVRTLWVEGGVLAGLGQRQEALPILEQVWRYFTSNEIAYDAALAALELAILHLEDGRTAEVKRLAEAMYWVFTAQGVHEQALAALRLFFEAARKGKATADLARRVKDYLHRARHNPELSFEA